VVPTRVRDIERIERAVRKQANGFALDTDDRWALKVHERHERERSETRAPKLDTVFVNDTPALFDADGVINKDLAEDIGYALAEISSELREDYTTRLHKHEVTIARLEGEMRALRAVRASEAVVASKSIGDAIEKSLCNFIEKHLRPVEGEVIDLPSWRQRNGAA